MFPALDAAQIARVAAFATEQSFPAGALVWEQGDRDVPFYVVLEGELEVFHPSGDLERPVTVHHPGEFTGEMALLVGRRRPRSARCASSQRASGRSSRLTPSSATS
jgi:thioredoxin reductase (NADPH)